MLIIEIGTGLPNAESYISTAGADAYHAARANTAWAALDTPTKEAKLRAATEYMVGFYRERWKGARASQTQVLDWPRYNVQLDDVGFGSVAAYVLPNTVPVEVQNACAVLALKAATGGDLAPDLDRETAKEKVGSIEIDYAPGARQYKQYRSIDLMLRPYLTGTGMTGQIVRS